MAGPKRPGWRWITLKGNHEDMMVSAHQPSGNRADWLINGGEETLASLGDCVPDSVLEWADALPLYYQDKHRLFVHAGVDETLPLYQQTKQILLWRRPLPGETGHYWGRHLVHGHTPANDNPSTVGNRTNIDSACVFGGTLTAAVFDDAIAGPPLSFISVAA
jgi:serine/threonine protein phosphatase 1